MNFLNRAFAALIACFLVWGCEEDHPQRSVASAPVTRVAWNQVAPSFEELSSYTFSIYVDGQPRPLADVRCEDTPRESGYQCSAALPTMPGGRRELWITTLARGQESHPSERFLTDVGSLQANRGTLAHASQGGVPPAICLDANRQECYAIRIIATQLGAITALTPIDDGRVLFIEDDHRVRIVDRDQLVATPALVAANASIRLVGMAADSRFATTRTVFVASTEPGRNGEELVVTRFREVAGVLGEPATILSGVGVASGEYAALGVDAAGRLYVSVPGGYSPTEETSLNGSVLRLTRDGLVPPENRAGSPIVAHGHQRPWTLAVDSSREQLWLSGRGGEGTALAKLTLDGLNTGSWPRTSEPTPAFSQRTTGATHVSLTSAPASSLFVIAAGAVARMALDHNGNVRSVEQFIASDARGEVTASVGAGSDLYVSVRLPLAREALVRLVRQLSR